MTRGLPPRVPSAPYPLASPSKEHWTLIAIIPNKPLSLSSVTASSATGFHCPNGSIRNYESHSAKKI
tara:strand:+ start:1021 stop:1221 length:201 start_codon:yes stop_codon:yes gene_type:complete